MSAELPKLVCNIPETCHILGDISRSTLWRLCKAGKLKPVRIGRRVLFTLRAINDFLNGDRG